MSRAFILGLLSVYLFASFAESGSARRHDHRSRQTIPAQDYGYVTVRSEAHMFWWLYGCTNVDDRLSKPLVMWLQGGPGGSSTGFGNFEEIGPLDVSQTPRNTTWVQAANILFVDNPVGTGYSYVDNRNALTTDVTEIANDLVTLFGAFLAKYPDFEDVPFYVFCESYGGKMTAAFGVALNQAIRAGTLRSRFVGVALGDSWISPLDSVKTWGPYLYSTSLINDNGLAKLQNMSDVIEQSMSKGDFGHATDLWSAMEDEVEKLTDNVDFYNILNHNGNSEAILSASDHFATTYMQIVHTDELSQLMNGPIKKALQIPSNVTWGGQAGMVFTFQRVDFMKDVISCVDELLASGTRVAVYSGQLDLIVDTMGTLDWVKKLNWTGLSDFLKAERKPLYAPSKQASKDTGAFVQSYDNLSFFWILKAGHMVPADAGEMALAMLEMIISGDSHY